MPYNVFTIGYGKWPAAQRAAKFLAALRAADIELLVDIRHSPCSSALDPANTYGPKEMNLQPGEAGIVPLLAASGIDYLWAVELGNPQKNDPAMRVLKEHLAAPSGRGWPVSRGLGLVKELVLSGKRVALMCACPKYAGCHRKPVAEALLAILPEGTQHRDLSG
ncbi:MAG: hypothetical protein JWO38_2161 [Gemmataceae bacterium]|nr:hypothetical protein [Gemmataceae bacterium]